MVLLSNQEVLIYWKLWVWGTKSIYGMNHTLHSTKLQLLKDTNIFVMYRLNCTLQTTSLTTNCSSSSFVGVLVKPGDASVFLSHWSRHVENTVYYCYINNITNTILKFLKLRFCYHQAISRVSVFMWCHCCSIFSPVVDGCICSVMMEQVQCLLFLTDIFLQCDQNLFQPLCIYKRLQKLIFSGSDSCYNAILNININAKTYTLCFKS